ncbi:hypothetical protein RHECNPAF_1340062 [Rhizobium etli CNPAF512]|nr:hypothetical protein RHECNPAF_1340062 [Rhizobium etli CNPAF512]
MPPARQPLLRRSEERPCSMLSRVIPTCCDYVLTRPEWQMNAL